MLRWLRSLLFWLLIATLPLKGLAAVVWGGCGPADAAAALHTSLGAPAAPHTQHLQLPLQHGHLHDATSLHHHPAAHPVDADKAPAGLNDATAGAADEDLSGSTAGSHCHHSAPCCSVVAPVPAMPGLILPLEAAEPLAALPAAPADVVHDVPHRPPR